VSINGNIQVYEGSKKASPNKNMARFKDSLRMFTSWKFMTVFAFAFLFSLTAASSIGFVPYYIDGTSPNVHKTLAYSVGSIEPGVSLANLPLLGRATTAVIPAASPARIIAPSIGLDLPVVNPTTTNVDALDRVLSSAVARYPGSAMLGQNGNVLIFGHSSHLPIVHNQMYKAFNGLPDLKVGAVITLVGGGLSYNYQVTTVRQTDATEEYVDLSTDKGALLTLSTCDTFGKKTARWIVEAKFVGTTTVAN
jgi:LPXTG-site transpeptidase (sortase) family protein